LKITNEAFEMFEALLIAREKKANATTNAQMQDIVKRVFPIIIRRAQEAIVPKRQDIKDCLNLEDMIEKTGRDDCIDEIKENIEKFKAK